LRFIDHTQIDTITHTHTVGVGAETSTYTTHNKYEDKTSIPSVEFEPAIPTIKQPQTYFLDDMATAIYLHKCSDHFSNNVIVIL